MDKINSALSEACEEVTNFGGIVNICEIGTLGDINSRYLNTHLQEEAEELNNEEKVLKNGQLFNAIRKNKPLEEKLKKVKKRLAEGADVNATDANNKNNTPLHIAVLKNELKMVNLLLDRGAIISIENADGKTPLDIAVHHCYQEVVNILTLYLKCPLQFLNQQDRIDQLPLIDSPTVKYSSQVNAPTQQPHSFKQLRAQIDTLSQLLQPPEKVPVQQNTQKKKNTGNLKKNQGEESVFVYSKRPGTSGLSGQLYETKLIMLVLLRALHNEDIDNFYLGTNVDGIGALDDIVFRYTLKRDRKPRIIFVQAKHRDDPNRDKITVEKVHKNCGDYSLQKYLDSYLSIKQKFSPKNNDNIFTDKFEDVYCTLIIYTPAKEDFRKKKLMDPFCMNRKTDPMFTSKAGKIFQIEYDDNDINLLVKTASEFRTKLLAENLAHFILTNQNNCSNMMLDILIRSYHVFLAQNVIKVLQTESEDYCKGKFLPTFFNNNEDLLCILRESLYKQVIAMRSKTSTLSLAQIKTCICRILANPTARTISKLVGSVLIVDTSNNRLKCIKNKIPQELIHFKDSLETIEVTQKIQEEAFKIAGEEELKSLSFNLPKTFGNVSFSVRGSEAKKEKRLIHLTSKLIELFKDTEITRNNIVKIDGDIVGPEKILKEGDVDINGGIGGLVGNLLIMDEETHMLKFNNHLELLPEYAKKLLQKLESQFASDEYFKHRKLHNYSFDINIDGFPRLTLVNQEYDRNLVKEFLGKLWFYTNQPKEDEVEKILKNEIEEHYNADKQESKLSFCIKSNAIFLKIHDQIQKWWKESKVSTYLTKNCKMFIQARNDVVDSPLLTILNFMYINEVEKMDVQFGEQAVDTEELHKFMSNSTKQILNIVTNESILSGMKLIQHFKAKGSSDHTFLDLTYILRIYCYKEVISQFAEATINTLIIGYTGSYNNENANENIGDFYTQLKAILDNKPCKQIIFLSHRDDVLAGKLEKDYSEKFVRIKDKMCGLIGLTPQSQTNVLENSNIIFQGKHTQLANLIDDNTKGLIDEKLLANLICNKEVEIGKAPTDSKYDDVKDYYIARTLNRYVKIKDAFKEKKFMFCVIYNGKDVELNLRQDQDIVLISHSEEEFKSLCNKYKDYNVHWLKQQKITLLWQQSQGNLSKLREFVDTKEQRAEKREHMKITDIPDTVSIITAEPGMGKSTILTHFAVHDIHNCWIIRINLINCSRDFNQWLKDDRKINEIEVVKFLYKAVHFQVFKEHNEHKKERKMLDSILKFVCMEEDKIVLKSNGGKELEGSAKLEVELFNHFYNQGKIAFLFDGFDEISPYYTEKVIQLLKVLKRMRPKKIQITTRPYGILHQLENELSTFSYTLDPFSTQDYKTFLEKYLKKHLGLDALDSNRFNIFTDELLKRFFQSVNDQEKEFMGIPLHVYMIARIFNDTFEEFYNSKSKKLSDAHKQELSEKLNLVRLYKHFIKIKFDEIRFGEKKPGANMDDPDMQKTIEKEREEFTRRHRILATYELLGQVLSWDESLEVENMIQSIKEGEEKTGIIDRVIDGRPCFIHRTFAEYFAASYVWEKFKSIQCDEKKFIYNTINMNLANDYNVQICKLFQLIAQEDYEMGNNRNFLNQKHKLQLLLDNLMEDIHVHESEAYGTVKTSIKVLLKIAEMFMSTEDIIEWINQTSFGQGYKRLQLLYVSADMGYTKLANVAVDGMTKISLKNSLKHSCWFYTHMWLAAKNEHLGILRRIVEKISFNCIWKDKQYQTFLQSILEKHAFSVLRSSLKLDIFDSSSSYEAMDRKQHSLLVDCLTFHAPTDIIELLIEKTDIEYINNLRINNLPAVTHISALLFNYHTNLLVGLVKRGINLNAGFADGTTPLNEMMLEFQSSSISVPKYFLQKRSYYRRYFYSRHGFLKFPGLIQYLLENGAVYDLQNTKGNTPLQLAKQTYHIHKLFGTILSSGHKENYTVFDQLDQISDKVLHLVIKGPNAKHPVHLDGYVISVHSSLKKITLEPVYTYHAISSHNKIQVSSKAEVPFVPRYIESLLFDCFEEGDTNGQLIKNALEKLSQHVSKHKEEMQNTKENGMLEVLRNKGAMSNNAVFQDLLERVMELYVNQNYHIDEALAEVSKEVLRIKDKILFYVKHLPKIEELADRRVYAVDEMLGILGIQDSNIDGDLLKIYESNGIDFLSQILLQLKNLGQNCRIEILESMFNLSKCATESFNLLNNVDSLFQAIRISDEEYIESVLQNAEQCGFLKAAVNACNTEYETIRDLAHKRSNNGIISILQKYIDKSKHETCGINVTNPDANEVKFECE